VSTAKRLIVSGRVQGVFYRQWTANEARALGLSGWVRNLRNGDVELLASGPDEALSELIRRCHEGPPAAAVEAVRVEDAEPEPLTGFDVRPTV
jgi:acylphosphatase